MNDRTLVITIGTSKITASLTSMGKKNKELLFSSLENLPIEKETSISSILSSTQKSIDKVLLELFNKRIPPPSMIHFVLSPLWFVSEFRNINVRRSKPFVFSTKLADELLRKEADLFQEEKREKYGDLREGDFEILELRTMKTAMNGYDTSVLSKKKIKELDMSIFISLSERAFLDKIKNIVSKHFYKIPIKFHSSALISFMTARELLKEEDFLLVTAGGELTEVSMIKKGVLKSSSSFPYGTASILREMSVEKGGSINDISLLFSLHREDRMKNSLQKDTSRLLSDIKVRWTRKFEQAVKEVTDEIQIPSTILLSTDTDFSKFFTTAILDEEMHQYDWTKEKFKIVFIPKERLLTLYFNSFI